jgi:hypothetical protein
MNTASVITKHFQLQFEFMGLSQAFGLKEPIKETCAEIKFVIKFKAFYIHTVTVCDSRTSKETNDVRFKVKLS